MKAPRSLYSRQRGSSRSANSRSYSAACPARMWMTITSSSLMTVAPLVALAPILAAGPLGVNPCWTARCNQPTRTRSADLGGLVVDDGWPPARPDGSFCASPVACSDSAWLSCGGGRAGIRGASLRPLIARALWPLVVGEAGALCDGHDIQHLHEAGVVVCLVAPVARRQVWRMVRRSSGMPGESGRAVRDSDK